MSRNPNRKSTPPQTERWVIIMVLAFVPVLTALFLPETARIPLVALGGLTFVAGFVLMIRESRRSGDTESLRQLVHGQED